MTKTKPKQPEATLCPEGFQKADWTEWRNIPQVRLWEAVALSLDIEPNSRHIDPHGTDRKIRFLRKTVYPDRTVSRHPAEPDDYAKRLRIAVANFRAGNPPHSEVDLARFAAWAKTQEPPWPLPDDLAHMKPAAPTAQEIGERREETLLKQIGALALLLSEKASAYRREGSPNASHIVGDIPGCLRKHKCRDDAQGLGSSSLSDSINRGLDLLRVP